VSNELSYVFDQLRVTLCPRIDYGQLRIGDNREVYHTYTSKRGFLLRVGDGVVISSANTYCNSVTVTCLLSWDGEYEHCATGTWGTVLVI
jgi:hypothetical protein